MNWEDKLNALLTGNGIDQAFLACNFTTFWPVGQGVAHLMESIPWLPSSYETFLLITNGAQFGTSVLFGVDGDAIATLAHESRLWASSYPTDEWLPIGKDATGNPILLHKDGSVFLGSIDSPGTAARLCDTFDALLDNVLMGDGYRQFMRNCVQNDEWFGFLLDQNWATR